MKIFGKKNCSHCSGKGYITFTASNVHEKAEMVPCDCLIKIARIKIPRDQMDSYDTKVEMVDGVRTMFLVKKIDVKNDETYMSDIKSIAEEAKIPEVADATIETEK